MKRSLWEQLSCGACAGPIAGKPAPTDAALAFEATQFGWERPCAAMGRKAAPLQAMNNLSEQHYALGGL